MVISIAFKHAVVRPLPKIWLIALIYPYNTTMAFRSGSEKI